jgi:CzcA family heavy metal efflux pump
MWERLIRWALQNRVAVLAGAILVAAYGIYETTRMPVDVLPDITAPTVTVITEAHGMAPQEVETLVSIPLETALNGTPGIRRLRSSSGIGLSIIWAEFDWTTQPYHARQVVAERIQMAQDSLPPEVSNPMLAPITSVMGEIMFIGLIADQGIDPKAVRDLAEWTVRRRLLSIPGIAQVMPIGGELKQYEIVLKPSAMRRAHIGHKQVMEALASSSQNAPGGFLVSGYHEYLIRGQGRAENLAGLGEITVGERGGAPILLRHISEILPGAAIARGTAAIDGKPAVVLAIQKQPAADTLELTREVDKVLKDLATTLPQGIELYSKGFRQAAFIEVAISNVTRHIVESALLVLLVLTLFLFNWRTTFISLVTLPLSILAALLALRWLGESINTMTLGGIAISIGALVDDAIIDVENVYRRLRQRASLEPEARASLLETIFSASAEIRKSIVYATAIIIVVFLPLFFFSGLEGRLLRPLGTAYVVALVSSLLVAVTLTPALCHLLLRNVPAPQSRREVPMIRLVRWLYSPFLKGATRFPGTVAILAILVSAYAAFVLLGFGRSFLPRFNEGSFTIAAATVPGASLGRSDKMVGRLEKSLGELDFITSTIRRTGRAERDEHAQDVQFSELEITVDGSLPRAEAAERIREAAQGIDGMSITVGQPISHRVEHMLSGVKTSIAIKVFGQDLTTLRTVAQSIRGAIADVPGVVDLAVEPQTDVPQVVVRPRHAALQRAGLTPGDLAEFVETAFLGHKVADWWEGERFYDLVVRYPRSQSESYQELSNTPISSVEGIYQPLSHVARVDRTVGPNLINRERASRRIVVMANTEGRDIRSVIDEIQSRIKEEVDVPDGYNILYGGEFESEAKASRTVLLLSGLAMVAMFVLMWMAFGSFSRSMLVMLSLPLSLIGGVVVVWWTGGVLTIASMVGFITLFGIAARNGIMLVSHYDHLRLHEGADLRSAVMRGSLERVVPILMTAMTSALALAPLAWAMEEPGNEIQAPMALVILGGLVSSTLLNLAVVPAAYVKIARKLPDSDATSPGVPRL